MNCKLHRCKNGIDFSKRGWGAKFCSAKCAEAYNQYIIKVNTSDKPTTKKDPKTPQRNGGGLVYTLYLQQKKISAQNEKISAQNEKISAQNEKILEYLKKIL